jgi:sec-independent protein translocase protein TatA
MGLDNPLHIAFLLILLLLVFGAKRLPEMGRSLGSGMRGFKDTLNGEQTHAPLVAAEPAAPAVTPVAVATVAAPAVVPEREPVAAVGEPGVPVA